ncbi:long-chain-fatty-acid--CoA ligase 1-like [Actinia tenebrosa]|uniref:Long-chain-fatty-acid--CoA ligase n=1 Tax=Actinia tenebrosa TaxID=6105 RepID=A0A6P8H8X4_ACTTE|nr:long-chain-fatty-acid--CoA ligase 1-like [Actinia tenebrosa]XP_031548876.1 long-chain-fatty-acid--CoA ligase 1-like [Actinia tenebrosa]XP_031548877.1 long-chain-fatty-acid--CoA ligase 1-like [Actinia tenebrosa]
MSDNAAEQALQYLRDPAVVVGLGAAAVSLAYMATRPEPTPCPVNVKQQSIELSNDNFARRSALTADLVEYLFEDCRTTHEVFLRGASISGDKPCLGQRSSPDGPFEWLSYDEVLERSSCTGSGLLELGCKNVEDDITYIGVYASNKIEWVLVEQACAMYSMVIIPLYDTLGPDSCVYIINQAKMTTVVCDPVKIPLLLERCDKCPTLKNIVKLKGEIKDEDREKAEKCGIKIIEYDDLEKMGKENKHEKKLPGAKDLAVVCYTSGTTGNPKGAMISHGNIISMLSGLVILIQKCGIQVDNNDVHISYLPLAHMYERLAQLLCFMFGGRVGFFGGNIRKIMEDLQELKPTLFISVPRVLNRVYDKVIKEVSGSTVKKFIFNTALSFKKAELERNIIRRNSIWDYLVFKKIQNSLGGRVRFVISGSAPLRDDVMVFLRCALGCIVLEGYGQTETTAASTIQLVGDNTFGHVGPPMPCNKIKLVDVPEMNYFAKDGKGEICFYGYNVFQGYLHEPEKTKEAVDEDGWLHSGDVGEWTENGTLKIIDRKKHIFKLSQGEYIAPEKIEAVYMQCPLVNQVFVYGNSHESCIVCLVVPDEAQIKKWAAKNGCDGDVENLCKNEKVRTAIFNEMIAMGKKEKLYSFQQVKAIYLHPDPFSVDNGLLTPTLKFKRPDITKHFKDTFEEMYRKLQD